MITSAILIQLFVLIVIAAIIFQYLIPLLPPPFNRIAQIVLVLVIIVWLLRLLGVY